MQDQTQQGLPPVHEAWLPREHVLHRPRHGGKQVLALVCAAIFLATPLVSQLLGARAAEIENRPLAPFPAPTDGWGFFTGLVPWATDHLVIRGGAITATDAISRGVFGEPPPLGDGPGGSGPLPDERQESDEDTQQDAEPVPQVIEGEGGWLYLGDEIESRCNGAVDLETTFGQLRELRDGVEATGRTFVLVIAPDKITMVPEYLPEEYAGRECVSDTRDEFWRRVQEEEFIVDLRGELAAWGDERDRPVYPRLDAHWADEGGVLMAKALAEAAQPGVSGDWVIEPGEEWSVPADLPPLIGRGGDAEGRDYALKPDGGEDRTREVDEDFHTPLRIDSSTVTGKVDDKVGLLGDSFTIRALPYLAASFRDLDVLHLETLLDDGGRAAAGLLADREVVAVEHAERGLVPENSALTDPEVVDTIVSVLAQHPIR